MPEADPASSVARALVAVRARIETAARAVGRDPASVVLTAVTKTQPPAAIDAILSAGQTVFGENRVQEAQGRWADRPRAGLELRLIGPLQTNKAEDAVALFDVIETLDRPKLAQALARAADRVGRSPRLLIQVNTGLEPQKAGCAPDAVAGLLNTARSLGLTVEGLMAIPPVDHDPRPHFDRLRELGAANGLAVLSMGMSGDFETAIAAGATHVRVGSALFGERNPGPAPS